MIISDQERFSSALYNSSRAWRQGLDRRLKYLGLSQASWLTIAMVAKGERPMSQTELANKLAVEDPTMVSMIDRLVKSGFVLRQPSETDRRVKLVVLTEAGQEVFQKVRKEATAYRNELLAGIDPQQLQAMTAVLEALQAAAEASA